MTNIRNIARRLPALSMALVASAFFAFGFSAVDRGAAAKLDLALVIQEDVRAAVASDIEAYRDFIRSLPAGTRVMVAYARVGVPRITQPFTADLEAAAQSVRPPSGLANLAPGSPYEAIKEVLKRFPEGSIATKKVVFVGDGFDRYAFGPSPADNTILEQAIRRAKKDGVEISTIFAPTAAAAFQRSALRFGQSSLNYLADQTGGKAFFTGDSYISAKPFLEKIREGVALETTKIKIETEP